MLYFQARPEIWEQGQLPLHTILPHLDSLTSLWAVHARLLARASKSDEDQSFVDATAVAECLEFHRQEHMEIFLQIFSGLSSYATTGPSARYNVHELSLFLLAELFAREAQRPDTNECWPEPAAIDTPSPIKLGSKSPLGTPRSAMRIQLQQHVKQQQHIMKNYGDYIRRNLGAVLSLLQDVPPPPPTPELVSGGGSMRLTAHQLDRASFLIHVADSTPEAGARPLSANCAPLYQGASPQAAQATSDVVALLRQQWHTDRFDSLFGALLGGAGRGGNGSTTPTMQPPAASPRPPFGIKAEPGMDVDGGGSGSHPPPLLSPPPQHRLKHEHQHAAAASSSTSSSAYGAMSPGTATHNPPQTVDRSLGMVASAGHVDRSAIQGVHKGSVIRGEGDLEPSLRILDCHDCFIYLLAPLQYVYVSGCSECTIVMGAVGRCVRLESSHKLQVMAAASAITISGSHDCTLYLGVSQPTVALGDNRFIRLAPFNTRYERQSSHMQAAGVRFDLPNRWDAVLALPPRERRGSSTQASPAAGASVLSPASPAPIGGSGAGGGAASGAAAAGGSGAAAAPGGSPVTGHKHVVVLPPEDFVPFLVPFKGGSGPLAGGSIDPGAGAAGAKNAAGGAGAGPRTPLGGSFGGLGPQLYPLPPAYEKALQRKQATVASMRTRIKDAVTEDARKKELQAVVQAYFREWLQGTNQIRQIFDLSKLEAAGEQDR